MACGFKLNLQNRVPWDVRKSSCPLWFRKFSCMTCPYNNSINWPNKFRFIKQPSITKNTKNDAKESQTHFAFFLFSFKMIGLAQGPGPCDSRRYVNSSRPATPSSASSICQSVHSNVLHNCFESTEFIVSSTSVSSLCTLTDYEKEVLRLVGPLTAEAPISRSAWSQWEEVRQITATTRKR